MKIPIHLATLGLALCLSFAPVGHAQTGTNPYIAQPTASVQSFGVQPLKKIVPGAELPFTLDGTPGATVRLRLAGATGEVPMVEERPGHYTGAYTVRTRDRLTAASVVTALVTKDGQTLSATMDQSLVEGARSPAPRPVASIASFTVNAPERARPGDELAFELSGAPAGKARVKVQGVANPIALTEVRRGVYEGRYTLRRSDRVTRDLDATAFLVVDRQETRQRFERAGDDQRRAGNGNSNQAQAQAACTDCGKVESVSVVTIKGDKPNVVGTIAGGLLGGVLGNQVGGGTGKDLATVAGAIGGAYAGNRIENSMDTTKVHRMVVRLNSGGTRTIDFAADPGVKIGTRVRVDNGTVVVL